MRAVLNRNRIIIASHDPELSKIIRNELRKFDFSISSVVSGKAELLHQINLQNPDLLLLDSKLLSNSECQSILLKIKSQIISPSIIFLAECIDSIDPESFSFYGDAMVLASPFNFAELAANITIAIQRRKSGFPPFRDMFEEISEIQCSDFIKRIGKLIKATRVNLSMTQALAAEKLGINYRYYQDIEAGRKNIKVETLFKIIKGLNQSIPRD